MVSDKARVTGRNPLARRGGLDSRSSWRVAADRTVRPSALNVAARVSRNRLCAWRRMWKRILGTGRRANNSWPAKPTIQHVMDGATLDGATHQNLT